MKWLKWTGLAVAALLVVLALLLAWALKSESGARFVLAKAQFMNTQARYSYVYMRLPSAITS